VPIALIDPGYFATQARRRIRWSEAAL